MLESARELLAVGRAALAAERAQVNAHPREQPRDRDDIEFLPAALEILETPTSPARRALLWTLIAFILIALAWSIIGKLDVVAVAQGKMTPVGQSKTIQPLEAGIVQAIRVVNGQHVDAGQALVELDPVSARADVDKSRSARVDAALAVRRAQALLDAQRLARAPRLDIDPGLDPVRTHQAQALADGAFAEYLSKAAEMTTEARKRQAELETSRRKVHGLEQTAPIARALADDYRKLEVDKFVSKHAWLEKEQTALQQEQDLAAERSVADELQAALDEQQRSIESARAQFRHEQLDAQNQAELQLVQAEADVSKATQRSRQTTLAAPVSGTVQQLAVHTVGGVVTPAQELLVVVPDGAGLELDVQVLNEDIGFLRVGQPVEIKFDAFPYTEYGTVAGTLDSIDRDAVKDDKLGPVYPARVRLARTWIADGLRQVPIVAGMAANAEIKTEQRRVIDYLLSPLKKIGSEAGRER